MGKEKLIQFLLNSNLVAITTGEEIVSHFEERQLLKNEFLLVEGKVSDEYFFLEAGFMRSFAHDIDGNAVTTNFSSANQIVFEISSFFNRTKSKENIQAITDCCGWSITYEQLNMLFHAMPEFREFGRSTLVKNFAALKTRMLSMITESAEERYVQLLNSNPEIFQEVPLKYIASYLGITDTSLSRIRKEFSKK